MLSSHECVKQIQDLLVAGEAVAKEKAAELVWAYATACRQLNERAQQCLDLLRQGRRSDAQRLAKEPPDLEQELRLLDFPERSDWLDLCESAGMPIAQGLDPDALGTIFTQIRTEGGRFDVLLKMFKRMALGHAPLADRLRVLRQIRKADPQHDLWLDDVRAFETARQAELLRETEAADAAGDLQTLEAVLAELKSTDWLTPPARLLTAVEKAVVPHRHRFAAARFAELSRDLREAHGRMDEPQCRTLLGRIDTVARETGAVPDAAAEESIGPVRTWIDQLDATQRENTDFETACTALEQALDANHDRPALERLAGTVFRFEQGMPELLAARFNTRMEELGRKAKRRFALVLTAIVGAVLIVAGAVTSVIVWQSRAIERDRWHSEIAHALEKGDLEGAGRLLVDVAARNPAVAASPEIETLRREHQRKVESESARLAAFQDLRKTIEAHDIEAPDSQALDQAAKLARTFAEKQWVEDWRQKYATASEEQRRRREAEFCEKLDALRKAYALFQEAEQDGRADLEEAAAPCLALVEELDDWTDVSESLRAQVTAIARPLHASLDQLKASADQQLAARRVIDRLPSLADRPDELIQALEAFVRDYPEHPLATDFAKAAGLAPHWQAIQAWAALVDSWDGPLGVTDAETVAVRLPDVKAYLKQYPHSPLKPAAQDYCDYLTTASTAFIDGRLIGLAKVREALHHIVFTDALRILRTTDNRTYYILTKDLRAQRANDRVMGYSFRYLVSTTPTFAEGSLSVDDIQEGPSPAPQIAFAKAALARLDAFKGDGWDTLYLDLAAMAQEQPGIDPILAGQVLQLVLDFAVNTSPYEVDTIKQRGSQISDKNLDFITWLNPRSESADRVRLEMDSLFQSIGPMRTTADNVRKHFAATSDALRAYRPAGIFLNGSGPVQWIKPPPNGSLYGLASGKAGTKPQFVEVGTVRNGQFSAAKSPAASLPQGSLLFYAAPVTRDPR